VARIWEDLIDFKDNAAPALVNRLLRDVECSFPRDRTEMSDDVWHCGFRNLRVYGLVADLYCWESADVKIGMHNLDGMCNEPRR
jgi:hypothetical protein